jgi:asparagine synthase (glutamine-hydrolysing)
VSDESPLVDGPTPLEVASGLVLGTAPAGDMRGRPLRPVEALEAVIRPALLRGPCLVSFSGGRDSSAVLAVAAALARRERLPAPIPVTNRFSSALAEETSWQERVVSHLRLDDWIRVGHDGELDCVGPVATAALRRHGLLWPFNAYFHVPLLREARGGSLLTGLGGDEMLEGSAWTYVRAALRSLRRRDAVDAAFVLSPRAARVAIARRQLRGGLPWLRDAARREVLSALARDAASAPRRWSAGLAWRRRLRYLAVASSSLGVLAEDEDVAIAHPFLAPDLVQALADDGPYTDRTHTMRSLFGGLLPDDVLARGTKACFDEAFWNADARAFAAAWDGQGVDAAVVDVERLRDGWLSARPDARSFLLAQAAWLAADRRSVTTSSGEGTRPHRPERSGAAAA